VVTHLKAQVHEELAYRHTKEVLISEFYVCYWCHRRIIVGFSESMLSRNILYSRKPASTPKRSIRRERETEDDDDHDHDNDSNMKKTIKNALQPVKSVFSNGLARFAGFAFLVFIYVTLAITFYQQYEGWTITDSMFFVTQTLSTTGYGYPAPSSDGSKLFTIFFILIGISVVFAGIHDFLYANLGVLRNLFCKKYSSRQIAHDLESGDIYHHRKYLVRMIFGLALTVVLGAIVIKYNEDLTWTTAFYFIVETAAVRIPLLFCSTYQLYD
jgi:hypothetical protein